MVYVNVDLRGIESLLAALASRVLSSTVLLVAHVFVFASCTSGAASWQIESDANFISCCCMAGLVRCRWSKT